MPGVPESNLHGASPHGRIINRNPHVSTAYSRALNYQARPQVLPANNEVGQDWTPYGIRATHPYLKGMPYSMMSQAQAGIYQSAVGLAHASGQADYPNGQQAGLLIRLKPTGSAHPGFTMPTGPNPNMVFLSPPVYGFQTKPLYATGL